MRILGIPSLARHLPALVVALACAFPVFAQPYTLRGAIRARLLAHPDKDVNIKYANAFLLCRPTTPMKKWLFLGLDTRFDRVSDKYQTAGVADTKGSTAQEADEIRKAKEMFEKGLQDLERMDGATTVDLIVVAEPVWVKPVNNLPLHMTMKTEAREAVRLLRTYQAQGLSFTYDETTKVVAFATDGGGATATAPATTAAAATVPAAKPKAAPPGGPPLK